MATRNPTSRAASAINAFRRGSIVRAGKLARQALEESPDDPDLLDVIWRCEAGQQHHREAAGHLARLLELRPADPRYRVELGKLQRMGGDVAAAEATFRRAREERPGDDQTAYYLAHLLRDRGKWAEARGLVTGLADRSNDPEALLQAATFLEGIDAFDDAAAVLERLLDQQPRHAQGNALYSRVMETLGRFDEAHTHCLRALEAQPEFPGGWLRLTWMRKVSDRNDPDLERLRTAAEDGSLSADSRACARFGLGKAYDDLADYPEAFAQFVRGNGIWRSSHEWSTGAWDREVEATLRTFDSPPPRAVPAPAEGPVPIFIVGMLRTGSTLLERLLARHSRIAARGEMTVLTSALRRLPRPSFPEVFPDLDAAEKRRIRETYLERLVRDDSSGVAFIDKSPLNFKYLAAIAELFPEAVIIHTRRDPRDVGLSLFFQPLVSPDSAYAFDMKEIVHYYRGYERVMAHWDEIMGDRIIHVDYESLVSEQEAVLRRLVETAGLPWEDGLLDAARDSGGIQTASLYQARQPVHRRSVARWRHYEALAPDFFRALAEFGR